MPNLDLFITLLEMEVPRRLIGALVRLLEGLAHVLAGAVDEDDHVLVGHPADDLLEAVDHGEAEQLDPDQG